ncbi:MAG: hypothetical protein ACOYJJ_02485 [Anaerovoracaceae bacterium]
MNNVSVKNVVKFAGAFVACAIGSGFATGQEVMQFFSGQGIMSIVGTIITTIVFAWCGGMFMKHGYEHRLESPAQIIDFYFGKKLGKAIELIFQIFLFGVFVIMIAGAGTTLSEYYGLNPMVGRIGMAAIAFGTVILGLTKLTDILGNLGTVIIVFAVGIGLVSFVSHIGNLSTAAAVIPTLDITKTAGGWLWSSILYPGFNAIVVIFLTCAMGRTANSAKEAMYGGVLGGILFGAAILVLNLGIIVNITDVYTKGVPTLALAQQISPIFALIFSVIICCGIYTTTVPMLWSVARHFAEDGSKKFVLIALGATVLGLALGMTSFKVLVNIIYPLSGYMGVALFGFIAYRELQGKKITLRKPTAVRVSERSDDSRAA